MRGNRATIRIHIIFCTFFPFLANCFCAKTCFSLFTIFNWIHIFFSTVCLLLQGIGFGCAVVVFFLQFLFAWLYHKSKLTNFKATKYSKKFKILRLLGYDVLIMIALIGNVASFRGFWNVLDVYFLPSKIFFYFSTYVLFMN